MRELSLHILDLVTNSIEAAANRIIIVVEERPSDNLFRIRIRDNGKGMSKEMVKKAGDPFTTSRKTRKVGMGIPLIQQVASDCGGTLKVCSSPGMGTTVTVEMEYSNINRPPLGDIVNTIINLMISNPEIHFCYIHTVNSSRFCLDSYWFLARMAEKNGNIYDIIQPAKEYITKGLLKMGASISNP